MKVSDPAYLLASVRAQGLRDLTDVPAQTVEAAQCRALACGRRLVECEGPLPTPAAASGQPGELRRVLTLGWSLAPVPEEAASYPVRRLSATQSLTFAVCLAAAWRDVRQRPYPGEPFRRADVVDTLWEIGADARAVKAAIDTDLHLFLLICKDGRRLRLGPAVAALPDTFAEAVRRMYDHLPRPHEYTASQSEDDES
ncbi:hypothetical protein E6W39_06550 [Kitasatospora acidiphila]|uniref:Uncharacterized protein n=1 Tax=Kitasatospora acidiphila TaxID=2567942 RepID=A0A540VZ38_9ACTN|nr:hypothetical protein [Kitasatospora acidiphila]TQF01997.1 hypothetical protein E6W39_06550 [Kitasatospora acidiphila]